MPAVVPLLVGSLVVSAAASGYSAYESHEAGKDTKKAREEAEEKAAAAESKLAADKQAAIELAAAQVEERKRAMARNKADLTGPLGVEEGQQKVKTALGQ